jgi:hypothetical protein
MKENGDFPVKLILIGVGLSLASLLVWVLWRWKVGKSGFGDFLSVIGIASSGALSVALILLYSQQKTILDEQTNLKRAELRGELGVDKYTLGGSEQAEDDQDEKDISLKISNFSSSKITNLVLKTEIFPKEIGDMELGVRGKQLQRRDEYGTQFGQDTGILPREQAVTFSARPSVFYVENDREMIPSLTFFIIELRKQDIEEVRCRMWIEGTDQLGETVKSKVLPWDKTIRIDTESQLMDKPTLEEVFRRSGAASIDDDKSEF